MEAKWGKRLGAALLGAVVLNGCGDGEKQIDGLRIVNCNTEPREASLRVEKAKGEMIAIGGATLPVNQGAVYLTSDGDGDYKVTHHYSDNNSLVLIDKDEDGLINIAQHGVRYDPEGNITFIRGGITYDVETSSGGTEVTIFDINASCNSSV